MNVGPSNRPDGPSFVRVCRCQRTSRHASEIATREACARPSGSSRPRFVSPPRSTLANACRQHRTSRDKPCEDVELATMHRVLETLQAAMNWGMAQTPPLFNRSPFHLFGVRLNKKAETARDPRPLSHEPNCTEQQRATPAHPRDFPKVFGHSSQPGSTPSHYRLSANGQPNAGIRFCHSSAAARLLRTAACAEN